MDQLLFCFLNVCVTHMFVLSNGIHLVYFVKLTCALTFMIWAAA